MEQEEHQSSDINQAPPASSPVTASQSLSKFGHNTFMDPDSDTPIVFETSKGILLFNPVKNKSHLEFDYDSVTFQAKDKFKKGRKTKVYY